MFNGQKFLFIRPQALSTPPTAGSISFYALVHNLKALYSVSDVYWELNIGDSSLFNMESLSLPVCPRVCLLGSDKTDPDQNNIRIASILLNN